MQDPDPKQDHDFMEEPPLDQSRGITLEDDEAAQAAQERARQAEAERLAERDQKE